MLKNLDYRPDCDAPRTHPEEHPPAARAELAATLRRQLAAFADALAGGGCALHCPPAAAVTRGAGHFHLAPELFLQVGGWTRFCLPHGELTLHAGSALLLPARLLHDEQVGSSASDGGGAFNNLVVHSDGQAISCHIALELAPGRPGIHYLEVRRHSQAARVLAWLEDASHNGNGIGIGADLQARALVTAALVGVRRAIDDAAPAAAPAEPALIARLRVLIHNQLGDHGLSVRQLAEQCGISADHLSHRFRQATGEHLVACINRLRMERAARLLADTSLAVKEVAWACGYATPSYFIRSFRSQTGHTPLAWRLARPGVDGGG
jgi:AraC-like DNA-binding protein